MSRTGLDSVLDIDLDAFVWPQVFYREEQADRPSGSQHRAWPPPAVERLLGRLGVTGAVAGRCVEPHVEVFDIWYEALESGRLRHPFHVVHVDAHEDLGYGDPCWKSIQEEILTQPLTCRTPNAVRPLLHSGNYLLGAAALGWLASITFIPCRALQRGGAARLELASVLDIHWQAGSPRAGALQLRSRSGYSAEDQANRASEAVWDIVDPPIPVHVLTPREFSPRTWTAVTVARSPAFSPSEADPLLELLRQRISPARAES